MSDILSSLRDASVAVLTSGGMDSAILLAELAGNGVKTAARRIVPVYVRFGLFWEQDEERALRQFLAALPHSRVEPLKVFDVPIRDVYGSHWSATGDGVPDETTPDEAVYLPGRNLLLLAPTAVWCHLQGIEVLALGHLGGNPFADSTREFFASYAAVINQALIDQASSSRIRIEQPYRELTKREVLLRGAKFPLENTWSCMRPTRGRQCGRCNKCAERKRAFADANLPDRTLYA